jgi:hypothetical protein
MTLRDIIKCQEDDYAAALLVGVDILRGGRARQRHQDNPR